MLGGPEAYTEEHGGHEEMLRHHVGLDITPPQRHRFAMENSRPGAATVQHAPTPRWGWGVAPPYQG